MKPSRDNKFYITKKFGGFSPAINIKDGWVLPNCVGYALGRFHELLGDTSFSYLTARNAEKFWDYKGELETGDVPKVGAVMVWQKGATRNSDGKDGCGHVAIVEEVISDTEVRTSESAFGGEEYIEKVRKKGKGRWGSNMTFLGFIYPPNKPDNKPVGVKTENVTPEPKKAEKDLVNDVYYPVPNCKGHSIEDALRKISAPYKYKHRCQIAEVNGITGYIGTGSQNKKMLEMLLSGRLKKI